MIKVCARCKSKLGVYTVDNVPVPDPWYCPSCENKIGKITIEVYESNLKNLADNRPCCCDEYVQASYEDKKDVCLKCTIKYLTEKEQS